MKKSSSNSQKPSDRAPVKLSPHRPAYSTRPAVRGTSARSRAIAKCGYFFIATNFFLGVFNIIVGLLSGSLAITSDAIHSFIDSTTGFLVILSEKICQIRKLALHRTKIERLTTVIIALIIIATGIHIAVESIEGFLNPEPPSYNAPIIVVVVASIAMKYLLAAYLKQASREHHSTVLAASGAETMNDTWISVAVLISAFVYLITGIDIENFISLIISLLIIKVGLEFIFPHISHHHHHPLESNADHDHCGKNLPQNS